MTWRRNVEPQQNNPKNDRVKREYLIYLKDARQRSPATVEQVRHAIDRLEAYTGFKDFGTFNKEQARGFKRALLGSRAKRSGKPLSTATAHRPDAHRLSEPDDQRRAHRPCHLA